MRLSNLLKLKRPIWFRLIKRLTQRIKLNLLLKKRAEVATRLTLS
jgi:hypothetical protein